MSSSSLLLFLRALSPIHAGVGRGGVSGEIVDLPVQRDEFGFPCIWSSSLKGAVRANVARYMQNNPCIKAVFGPEASSPNVSEYSSTISLLDAKLLLIPFRSIKGVWIYATTPHFLNYLMVYYEAVKGGSLKQLENISTNVVSRSDIFVKDSKAVLNEELVELKHDPDLVNRLFQNILPDRLLDRVNKKGLVVLDDDTMKALVGRSLLVQYRVRLKHLEKTVDEGPWSEEYLPEETVLVSALVCREISSKARELTQCNINNSCEWLIQVIETKLGSRIWLGGRETLGRGFVEVSYSR